MCCYSAYKWLPASCATDCTNRTRCRLTPIFPQKMHYFCPITAVTNLVACSGFLLFSISWFPTPPVPHLHHLLQLHSLKVPYRVAFMMRCFFSAGITGKHVLNSYTIPQTLRQISISAQQASKRAAGKEHKAAMLADCWMGNWSHGCLFLRRCTAQHFPRTGFSVHCLDVLHKPQFANNCTASVWEF